MNSEAAILIGAGALIAAVASIGLVRPQPPLREWQPEDRISLIEFGISKVAPNFVPAGELPIERTLSRLMCWFGLVVGVALISVGLWYIQA